VAVLDVRLRAAGDVLALAGEDLEAVAALLCLPVRLAEGRGRGLVYQEDVALAGSLLVKAVRAGRGLGVLQDAVGVPVGAAPISLTKSPIFLGCKEQLNM
jgi:hypothetical protein